MNKIMAINLSPLTLAHDEFVLKLVNTPGWLRFIGDRKIQNTADAKAYIEKITNGPAFTYWVVTLTNDQVPAGIITFIRRDYLEYPDIGFAFLPEYTGKGYAFEAAQAVIADLMSGRVTPHLLATTIADNERSIALLTKLGFTPEKVLVAEGTPLLIYGRKLYDNG